MRGVGRGGIARMKNGRAKATTPAIEAIASMNPARRSGPITMVTG